VPFDIAKQGPRSRFQRRPAGADFRGSGWHDYRWEVDIPHRTEKNMPTLPSGRRVEFSLDRFHGFLERIGPDAAREVVADLSGPDDLLFVLEAVHFRQDDGCPYFAGYVAADWATYATDWNTADRQALQAWLFSPAARKIRAEAVDYVRGLYLEEGDGALPYPYAVIDGLGETAFAGSRLRQ
jgi:hypothetical protein